MPVHQEERRVAALLRDLVVASGAPVEMIESRVGWEEGKLSALLEGRSGLSFTELLEVLQVMDTTPPEFFARLYGFEGNGPAQDPLDRMFEESRRVVRNAVNRRLAWKQDKGQG